MTTEQFEQKQEAMSNEELIVLATKHVSELAKTGGRSHKMSVPPSITDTDMVFCELIKRFKTVISNLSENKRSCFNCKNRSICFVFREIMNASKEIEVNIDGNTAPGKWTEVFDAMGKCCLKFSKWQDS